MIMQRTVFPAITLALAAVVGSAIAAPVNYKTPDEVAAFKPGPNLEVVQGNCTACHSSDYINTQPPMKDKKGFWQAEVTKMIKGLWRADRRCRCRQDRRLPGRDLLTDGAQRADRLTAKRAKPAKTPRS
ncbi:hypothetical protein ACVWZZ_002671 [Bradyrhizobium sp. LM6.10]